MIVEVISRIEIDDPEEVNKELFDSIKDKFHEERKALVDDCKGKIFDSIRAEFDAKREARWDIISSTLNSTLSSIFNQENLDVSKIISV